MRRLFWLTGFGIVALAGPPLKGQEESDCEQTFETAKQLQLEGKLNAASAELIRCSQPTCDAAVARECTHRYSDVQRAQPSVTLVATKDGQPLANVRVFLDGEPFAEALDGRAKVVDPGIHEFRFELDGVASKTVQAFVVEGEKNKPVSADFSAPIPSVLPESAPSAASPPSMPLLSATRPTPASVYVLSGLGVAALAGGGVLRWMADSDFEDLERSCKPACTMDDMDPVKTKYLLSQVAFGGGAAALVTAGILYLARPTKSAASETGLSIVPTRQSAGFVGTFRTRF